MQALNADVLNNSFKTLQPTALFWRCFSAAVCQCHRDGSLTRH